METKIEEVFPELLWIGDEHLRERVKSTFHLGIREGGIALENLKQMPYTASYNTRITYQAHVRLVTKIAAAMYDACFPGAEKEKLQGVSRDYLVAGALLHDVGKLLELEWCGDGNVIKSSNGLLLRHAFTGVYLAMKNGLPDEVTHIIAVHSKEAAASHPTLLAHFVRLADQTAERYSDWELQQGDSG